MVYTIKNGLKKAYLAAMKTATTWDALFELGDLVEFFGPNIETFTYKITEIYDENLEKIGMAFGGKNHATVCHSVDKIKREIETNEQLKVAINKIYSQLNNVNNSKY